MIYYLVQSTAAHPDLPRGIPPAGLLNGAEERAFRRLMTNKRREDWLLGRWTAKRLLQAVVQRERGEYLEASSFTIINAPSGAPIVTSGYFANAALSISHRDGYALCAAAAPCCQDGLRLLALGADIERVESRDLVFAADYFTEAELARVRKAPEAARDLLVSAIWSAKEATLKALRLGLTVDTRTVSCSIDAVEPATAGWLPFQVSCQAALPGRRAPALKGWWRVMDEHVLTLVAEPRLCSTAQELEHVTCGSPLIHRPAMQVAAREVWA